jgi:hypothetical protein
LALWKNEFRDPPCSFAGPLCCSFLADSLNMLVTRASLAGKFPAATLGIDFSRDPFNKS